MAESVSSYFAGPLASRMETNNMGTKESISIIGCGWLGKPLAGTLIDAGYSVRGSTTHPDKLPVLEKAGILPYLITLGETHVEGQVGDFFDSPTVIVNVPPQRKRQQAETYLGQMRKLVDELEKGRTSRVLMVSTTSVYPDRGGDWSETDAEPGHELIGIENLFRGASTFSTTVIRFAGLVGPDRNPGRFLAGKTGVPGGDGVVNLIHLHDCIGIIRAVIEQGAWGKIFNACAREHPKRSVFYARAATAMGLPPPTFLAGGAVRTINAEKVRRELGYHFQYDSPFEMIG